jgi:hypothetical protein
MAAVPVDVSVAVVVSSGTGGTCGLAEVVVPPEASVARSVVEAFMVRDGL